MERPLADSRPFGPFFNNNGSIASTSSHHGDIGFIMEMIYDMDTSNLDGLMDELEDNINDLLVQEYSVSVIEDVDVKENMDNQVVVSVMFGKNTFTDPEEDTVIDMINKELSRIGRDDAEFVTYKYYF